MSPGKTMDELLSEARRKARLRMNGGGKPTAYAPGDTLLDAYTVRSSSMEGGMGAVWKVEHRAWQVELAMKRPKPELFLSDADRRRFIRECEAWIELGLHPNIVSCYFVREIDGVPSVFSEWMDGGNLSEYIQSAALYDGSEQEQQCRVLDIAIQFARGLQYAHDRGLIHQDVKPANVLLGKDGSVKVSDFGLAGAVRSGGGTQTENRNGEGTLLSPAGSYTLRYASPEQLNGKTLTRRTDIFSWAVSVLELYYGAHPWTFGTAASTGFSSYAARCRLPMSDGMQTLLRECLAEEPEARPHDFAPILERLLELYRELTGRKYPHPVFRLRGDSADALNNRALSYLELGKESEAEELFLRALSENPMNSVARYNYTLFALRRSRIAPEDARLLMQENWSSNPSEEVYSLFVKILYAIGGEKLLQDSIPLNEKLHQYNEASYLRRLLREGNIHSDFVLSRIVDIAAYESREAAYEEALREIRSYVEAGDYRNASDSLQRAEYDEELADCINRREWLELSEQVKTRCFLADPARIWTAAILPGQRCCDNLSFSADSARLLCGERLYDVQSGRLISDNGDGSARICSPLSPDGESYLRAENGGFARICAADGKTLQYYKFGYTITRLLFSPDGTLAVVLSKEGIVMLTTLSDGSNRAFRLGKGAALDALIRYDNRKLIVQGERSILLVDPYSGESRTLLRTDRDHCSSMAIDSCFENLVLSCPRLVDCKNRFGVLLYELSSGESVMIEGRDEMGHGELFEDIRLVRWSGNDATVQVAEGKLIWTLFLENDISATVNILRQPIRDFAFSRNGRYAAALSGDTLYLQRRVYSFVYALPDGDMDRDSLALAMTLWTETAAHKMMADPYSVRMALQKRMERHMTYRRRHGLEGYYLYPYARICISRFRDRSEEEQFREFMQELADRGAGYIDPEDARTILDKARRESGIS